MCSVEAPDRGRTAVTSVQLSSNNKDNSCLGGVPSRLVGGPQGLVTKTLPLPHPIPSCPRRESCHVDMPRSGRPRSLFPAWVSSVPSWATFPTFSSSFSRDNGPLVQLLKVWQFLASSLK